MQSLSTVVLLIQPHGNSLNPASKDKNIIKFLYQEAISCVFSTYQSHKWDSHLISAEYNTSNLSLISLCNVSVNLLFNLGKKHGLTTPGMVLH